MSFHKVIALMTTQFMQMYRSKCATYSQVEDDEIQRKSEKIDKDKILKIHTKKVHIETKYKSFAL